MAHFCSMCGPKFCSMKITQEVREYAAEHGLTDEQRPSRRVSPSSPPLQGRGFGDLQAGVTGEGGPALIMSAANAVRLSTLRKLRLVLPAGGWMAEAIHRLARPALPEAICNLLILLH